MEGWTSTCSSDDPSVSEVMIDACSNEFRSEYSVLKTGNKALDVRNLGMNVINPTNNAYVGSVTVQNNNTNTDALRLLNDAAFTTCGYGTVFRNAFDTPYNGIVPPNSTILFFNNKDSTDVSFLSTGELRRLCGSKVFVVFGTIASQSPGVNLFRNYPQNGSCGTTGCLRQIQFRFGGSTSPYCTFLTYDIKKLPNLNTSNPPAGFNEGSYIRPNSNGTLSYGGGNLTGAGVVCMPPEKLLCNIPTMPDYSIGFWNVLAYDGFNDFSNGSFKGFYQAKGNHTVSIGTATVDNFEFNTIRDGWGGTQSPSEAHDGLGALTTYNGCNVRADSFSILAKRKGFDCSFYEINLNYYDDFTRMRIDNNGDGIWDFDQSFNFPACSSGCGTKIWQGFLSPQSKIEIYAYDLRGNFNVHFLFQKKQTPPSVKINVLSMTPVVCGSLPTGSITTTVTGGIIPYNIVWSGVAPIPNGSLAAANLPAGLYQMQATDGIGCIDSAQILVPQINNIVANATGDTSFCPGGTAILRGTASGGTGTLRAEWLTTISPTVLSTSLSYSPIVSKSTNYVLRITDGSGCFKTDTLTVNVFSLPVVHVSISPNNTVCNDAIPILRASGAQTYTWSSFPQIGAAALDARGDSARLFSLFLPAPYYIFTATGTDANGCKNTGQVIVTIVPLPVVTILPILDTLCDNSAPIPLNVNPATGGTFIVYTITPTSAIPCLNCVENGMFYPDRAGAGEHLVSYSVVNAQGCGNSPSINVFVKNCRCVIAVTVPLSKSICPGDSFRVKNIFYKTAGVYRDTFRKTNGCDSIVLLNLTLYKLDTTRIFGKTCNPTQVGTTTQVLRNQYGCDSLVVLNLTLNKSDTTRLFSKTCNPAQVGTTSQLLRNQYGCDSLVMITKTFGRHDTTRNTYVICTGDSVFVNNTWIKTGGETRFNLQNNEGCDSIVIANIAFTKKDTTYQTATSCDPTRVGLDTVRKVNRNGCDSLVITRTTLSSKDSTRFNLTTCNPARVGDDIQVFQNRLGCDSVVIKTYVLQKADTTYSFLSTCNPIDTGTRQLNLQNRDGCDSIVLIKTSLNRRDSTLFAKTICAGDSLAFYGRWITAKGTYYAIRTNSVGCDSVLVLILDFWKNDTTIVQKTSCNPLLVGDSVKILRGYRGCDSVIVTQTRLVSNNMKSSINISKSISCNGFSDGALTTIINSGGLSPFSYQWSNGSKGNTTTSLSAGNYIVSITDAQGCRLIDSMNINNPPPLSINAFGMSPPCFSDKIGSIRIMSAGGGTAPYRFESNVVAQNITTFPTVLSNIGVGTYNFKLIDSKGCTLDSTIKVPAALELKVDAGADLTIQLGDSTQIGAVLNFQTVRYQWTPKDGQIRCDTCLSTIVSPSETTVYKLTVKDAFGCEVSDALTVFVDKNRPIFIPTSFSPNEDGVNDRFTVFSDYKVRKVQTMKIFNRWGSPVFEQNDFLPNDENQGWDGRMRGVVLPPDVYVYFVRVEFVDGKVYQYQGDVTILK